MLIIDSGAQPEDSETFALALFTEIANWDFDAVLDRSWSTDRLYLRLAGKLGCFKVYLRDKFIEVYCDSVPLVKHELISPTMLTDLRANLLRLINQSYIEESHE